MSSRRLTAIVAGLVILLALTARAVIGGSRGASDIAVDTTGASARATMTSRVLQATVAAKPLLVISPRTVRHGASIGLWGSGFPSGATVDIYLKQEASDSVNPVTVVEADKNGQFTGVTVTVPDSVPSGSLIIQAKEYQGSLTAMATATVTDGADAPQAATPTAAAAATPTAMAATPTTAVAATPTTASKPAAQPQPTPQSKPTQQPQPTSQPHPTPQSKPTAKPQSTPQPHPTPQSKPTQQPQPTSQPHPTPQSKPTAQPQPTPQSHPTPQPKPTEQRQPTPQPQPKPETHHSSLTPSSYTVQAGDNLSAIAEHVYGDANEWRSLYDSNREAIGDNPNLIHPGTELVVPP
jgi:nucleoid-associated protein YgaU